METTTAPTRLLFVTDQPATDADSPRSAACRAVRHGYRLPPAPPVADIAPADDSLTAVAHAHQLVATPVTVPLDMLTTRHAAAFPLLWEDPATPPPAARVRVLWNCMGGYVQVLDTTDGHQWLNREQLVAACPEQPTPMTAAEWQTLAAMPLYSAYWQQQLLALGFERAAAHRLIATATRSPDWQTTATLDATLRMLTTLRQRGALAPGRQARELFARLYRPPTTATPDATHAHTSTVVPAIYWRVRALPHDSSTAGSDDPPEETRLVVQGVRLTHIRGVHANATRQLPTTPRRRAPTATAARAPHPAAPSLSALLRQEGRWLYGVLAVALVLSSGAVVLQALLLRSVLGMGQLLATPEQGLGLLLLLVAFALLALLLEWRTTETVAQVGRRLDARLRIALYTRLPTMQTASLRQQATADLMERIHASRDLHNLPEYTVRVIRNALILLWTFVGISWINVYSGLASLLILAVLFVPLLLSRSLFAHLNLEVRASLGQLARLNLDSMLGLLAIQAHTAQQAVTTLYAAALSRWLERMLTLSRWEYWVAVAQQATVALLIGAIIGTFVVSGGAVALVPLLVFWLLQLAVVGREFARSVFRWQAEQSKCTRFLDLLHHPTTTPPDAAAPTHAAAPPPSGGMAVTLRDAHVRRDEQTLLHPLSLDIAAGSSVAIVGASGAGKSTLLGVLSGQHPLSDGDLCLDNQPTTPARLARLAPQIAWVDPAVQLWNRSLLYNLTYSGDTASLSQVLHTANLSSVVERLPDGTQTVLGERGQLVSGGQGQRVRLGRALQRSSARLVLLDEPFRGLEAEQRATLLQRVRAYWADATLLCATHDVTHTTDFDRVLVIAAGRIVEDGAPTDLLQQPTSHYARMHAAAQSTHDTLWHDPTLQWRTLWLAQGRLQATAPLPPPDAAPTPAPIATAQGTAPSQDTPPPPPSDHWQPLAWDARRADEAVRALAHAARIGRLPDTLPENTPVDTAVPFATRLDIAARRLGLTTHAATLTWNTLADGLHIAAPAVIAGADGASLLLVSSTRWWVRVLTPAGKVRRLSIGEFTALLVAPHTASLHAATDDVATALNAPPTPTLRVRCALAHDVLGDAPLASVWQLRVHPATPFAHQLVQTGLWRYLGMTLGGEALISLSYAATFALLVLAASSATAGWVWLVAAVLALLLRVPAEMTRWLGERLLNVGARVLVRRRLFAGVLAMPPDTIRQHGTGQFLSWIMESERLEQLAQAAPALVSTALSLLLVAGLLAVSVGGVLHSLLLLAVVALVVLIGRYSLRAYLAQRQYHHQMSRDLLERIEGHQTRTLQGTPARQHDEEDEEITHYHQLSRRDDFYRSLLAVVIPYGWLTASLVLLAPAFLMSSAAWFALGGSLLGTLWAFQLLQNAIPDILDVIRAIGARRMLAPIEAAAAAQMAHDQQHPPTACHAAPPAPHEPLLEMHNVQYRYPQQPEPTLHNCHLVIHAGERLLLQGTSGGGKSTLAAIIAGHRQPQTGIVLLQGRDLAALGGDCWHQRVVLAPQFHENHIFNATLLFNLLPARAPHYTATDRARAREVCRALQLDDLLARMPHGLDQPVGETGWHLSHGEQSRVFLARALLQPGWLIILDESFAALDAATLHAALHYSATHARTLLVIAHP